MRSVRVTPSLAVVLALAAGAAFVRADGTPQGVPFTQSWTDAAQITANDLWNGVPGIQGFLGQDVTTGTGVDPQTLLTTSAAAAPDLDVIANQSNTGLTNGGVSVVLPATADDQAECRASKSSVSCRKAWPRPTPTRTRDSRRC